MELLIPSEAVSTKKTKLAVVSTHPIQYHSPWFRAMASRPELNLHVYYCHKATPKEQADAGFGVEFDWDVPLLEGYPYTFLKNVAASPGHGRFGGFDTPGIEEIIRRREYDAILVNGWHYKSAWQAICACWRSKVKVMVRSDSHLHTPRGRAKRAFKFPDRHCHRTGRHAAPAPDSRNGGSASACRANAAPACPRNSGSRTTSRMRHTSAPAHSRAD